MRTIAVYNSPVTLSVSVSGTTGNDRPSVTATSLLGVVNVTARLDATDIGTLLMPNVCSRYCGGTSDRYRFNVDAMSAGSRDHVLTVTATDTAGNANSLSVPVIVKNAPVLALTSPGPSAFATGTLTVASTATSDKPGAVRTTARLGDIQFLDTQNPSFADRPASRAHRPASMR